VWRLRDGIVGMNPGETKKFQLSFRRLSQQRQQVKPLYSDDAKRAGRKKSLELNDDFAQEV